MNDDILKLMIAQTEKELKTFFHKKTGKPQELLEEINRVLSQVIVPAKLLATQTLDCDDASINVNQAFENESEKGERAKEKTTPKTESEHHLTLKQLRFVMMHQTLIHSYKKGTPNCLSRLLNTGQLCYT